MFVLSHCQNTLEIITDNNENHELDRIPPTFRKNYYWPEKLKTKSKRKPKEKVLSVATSEEWNICYNTKSIEKAQKEEEQRQKAQKRKSAQEERAAKKVGIEKRIKTREGLKQQKEKKRRKRGIKRANDYIYS